VEEIRYARDSRFICTELANEVWRLAGYPPIPRGVIPIPAAFARAFEQGKLKLVGGNGHPEIGRGVWWHEIDATPRTGEE